MSSCKDGNRRRRRLYGVRVGGVSGLPRPGPGRHGEQGAARGGGRRGCRPGPPEPEPGGSPVYTTNMGQGRPPTPRDTQSLIYRLSSQGLVGVFLVAIFLLLQSPLVHSYILLFFSLFSLCLETETKHPTSDGPQLSYRGCLTAAKRRCIYTNNIC